MVENKQIKLFENLSQRFLYGVKFAFSDFQSVESENVSAQTQKDFYDILKSFIDKLYLNPALLGLPIEYADEYFNPHECMNQRPE